VHPERPQCGVRGPRSGACAGVVPGALAGVVVSSAARGEHGAQPPVYLALITAGAMAFSCMIAGIAGTTIPLVLKRLGADPATASSIFLTTITDVVSMGTFLGLVTWLLL